MSPICETHPILVRSEVLPERCRLGDSAPVVRFHLTRLARERSQVDRPRRLLRLVLPIERVDVLDWLAVQRETPRFYWRSRNGEREVASVGALTAREAASFGQLDPLAIHDDGALGEETPATRLAVTARFQSVTAADPSWRVFGRVRTWLPRAELHRVRDHHWFTFSMNPDEPRGIDPSFFSTSSAEDLPLAGAGELAVDAAAQAPTPEWLAALDHALAEIERGAIEKVVLAHRFHRELRRAPSPLGILRALREMHENAFVFGVLPTADDAFVGASPELLLRRSGRAIESEALAGTRPRGITVAEDDALARDLEESPKDQCEHEIVVSHLERQLAPLCASLREEPRTVRGLSNVQHLSTRFAGTLLDGITDVEILSRLHPTPAVCGNPTGAARALIAAIERFDRGLYGGVVGWLGERESECAVAIRCARVKSDELSLYAGVGIVAGSSASSEWDEITSKLATFHCLLQSHAP
jgi:menaquinone-specific isochorismate synthase